VFLPNERAIEPQITAIYRRFGLNDRQIEIIARATPKRDYYCQSRRGNRLSELGLGPVALAFCAASSKADHAAIERVLAEARPRRIRPGLARRARTALGGRSHPRPDQSGDAIMIKLRHLAAASAVMLSLAIAAPPASGAVDRLRSDQLQPERAHRSARAPADQQSDHDVDQSGDFAGQPGAQPRQPCRCRR